MNRVCVFCGSNSGSRPVYAKAAEQLGRALVRRRIGLVYGGGKVGLMGTLADVMLAEGGEVIGVIPHGLLAREVGHERLTQLHVVETMHERKAMMADLSGGFVAMPGGFGTFEEFCEVVTWAQLGIHAKPCGLLNVEGYYDSLLTLFDHAVGERFLKPQHRGLVIERRDPEALLDAMERYEPPALHKWIDRDET